MSGYISPILTIVIVGSQLVGTYYHNCNQYASLFIPTGWIYPISPYYPHIIPIFSPYYPHIIPIFLAKLYHNSCEQPPPMRHAQVAAAAALAAETTLPRMADVLTCSIKL